MHSRIKTAKISKATEISSRLAARPRCSCLSRRGLNEGRREDVRVAEESRVEDEAQLRAEAKYRERRTRVSIF